MFARTGEKQLGIFLVEKGASGLQVGRPIEKMGVPCKQLHNYDYGGPYAGFVGAAVFYREIDRLVPPDAERNPRLPRRRPVAPRPE